MPDSIPVWRSRLPFFIFCFIYLLSLPIKFVAAQHMVWEMDYVPVFTRGLAFFETGVFPAYGTLSSVAAYNMPFLIWLQMPAMLVTRDPFIAFFLTQLIFNLLTTWVIYRCGTVLFSIRVGLLAAALFTVSETGISSSYTAWAQLLLPGFFIMVFYCVWQWITLKRGFYLMLAGVIATAAFMTHFAAIMLYPAMFVMALMMGARWQWRWLLSGVAVCLLMLTPYIAFQIERDFVDVRAFLQRDTLIAPEIMAQYDNVKPGGNFALYLNPDAIPADNAISSPVENLPEAANSESVIVTLAPGVPQRILQFIVSIPGQYVQALRLPYTATSRALPSPMNTLLDGFNSVFMMLMYGSLATGFFMAMNKIRQMQPITLKEVRNFFEASIVGRLMMLVIFILTIISLYIVTRASPSEQPTYYMGLVSLQFLIIALALDTLSGLIFGSMRLRTGCLVIIAIMFMSLNGAERILRVQQHDDAVYSAFNAWLYEHVDVTTTWIASDWQSESNPIISYDILLEMRHMWWILPWYTSDDLYRMGTPYDVLLDVKHGIINQNQTADGLADDADYIIVYEPGLQRYPIEVYDIMRFGTTFVLKPRF